MLPSKGPAQRPLALLLTLAATGVFLVSCGDTADDPDTSANGRLAFGCALAEHIQHEHGMPTSWEVFIGNDADAGVRESATVGSILATTPDQQMANDAGLVEAGEELLVDVTNANAQAVTDQLDQIITDCEDIDISTDTNVSHQGQLDYVCALSQHLDKEHGPAANWVADVDEPVWYLASTVSAAVGGWNDQILDEHAKLSSAGHQLRTAMTALDDQLIDQSLQDFDHACQTL